MTPLPADLDRRGLIERKKDERYSALGPTGATLRRPNATFGTGERLINCITVLANGGRLTPGRLVDDAAAILDLSEWAAEHEQWASLLELVQTVQACFSIAHRLEELQILLAHAELRRPGTRRQRSPSLGAYPYQRTRRTNRAA